MRALVSAALAALVTLGLAGTAVASEAENLPARDWPFDGLFGAYDQAALQRGFQVYMEVCSSCHGVKFLKFRNLGAIGLSATDIKAIAAEFEVADGIDEDGETIMRPAIAADPLPVPFASEIEARAANNGALPPDLSLITKARKGGADYVYAILTSYEEAPDGVEVAEGMNYSPYFPGQQIAMPEPLGEDAVEYSDGTEASVEQMAADVVQFLAWAAEPELEARKRMGIKAILFLIVLSALFYASKRKAWAKAH